LTEDSDKTYQLEFERRSDYLLVRVTGQNTAETVAQYLQDLKAECHKHQCFRVLIDEQLEGKRLDIGEVFAIASDGAMDAMGLFQAIAYVEPKMGEMGDFAENAAVNRGMPVRMFATVAEADEWLTGQPEGSGEKTLFEEHNARSKYR
jgi:hypothetical protein